MVLDSRSRRARTRSGGDAATPDSRLALLDQAGIQLMRASGRKQLIQTAWIYESPVDMERLREFHQEVGYGLAGRRVERSPVPFGRQRWVAALGPQSELDVDPLERHRDGLSDWLDERSQVPVDPERGPGWHVGVLRMTDGSTAVSVVASHNLGDGIAGVVRICEAVAGYRRDYGYPPPRSRTWRSAAAADVREAARELPQVTRTAVEAAKSLRRLRKESTGPVANSPTTSRRRCDFTVVVPTISVFVDFDEWDGCAHARGGTGHTLLAGFAARVGERMGRARADDGAITLAIALNERNGADDTRAIALSFAKTDIDPGKVTTDLSAVRLAIRDALATAREVPDSSLELLPLVPWVPKRVLEQFAGHFLGSSDLAVYCSSLGDVDPTVSRPAGDNADYVIFRGVDQNVRWHDIEQAGGQLVVVAGRCNGRVSISISGYQVDAENSKSRLRDIAARTLDDFEISGLIV